ncbi:MAG: hypothetical protein QXD49_05760 [Archaeoglobaceae archaeon]
MIQIRLIYILLRHEFSGIGMKKKIVALLLLLALASVLSFCAEESSSCRADKENAKCSIAKDGIATLSNLNLPSNAKLVDAKICHAR